MTNYVQDFHMFSSKFFCEKQLSEVRFWTSLSYLALHMLKYLWCVRFVISSLPDVWIGILSLITCSPVPGLSILNNCIHKYMNTLPNYLQQKARELLQTSIRYSILFSVVMSYTGSEKTEINYRLIYFKQVSNVWLYLDSLVFFHLLTKLNFANL